MSSARNYSDEDLIVLVRTTNKQLYAELMRRYELRLLRYVVYLIGDEQLALDVVQETFIKVYTNAHSFNTTQKFSSWIYRIAHNQAMNAVNRSKTSSKDDIALLQIAGTENVEDTYIQQELHTQLEHCLSKLPVMYREPLVLYFLDEKSYQEISDILRLPISTVGTRINRAKQYVKNICQKKL